MLSQLILPHRWLQASRGQVVHHTVFISFSVPHITEASNDGQVYSSLMPLKVNSISLATRYEFRHENQSIYLSKDLCKFVPRRQWPNIILPVPAPKYTAYQSHATNPRYSSRYPVLSGYRSLCCI